VTRLLAAAIAVLALAVPASALATTVNSTGDSGTGSLRDAVATGGSIDFAPGLGPITLNSTITASALVTISDPEGDVNVTGSGSFPMLEFATGSGTSSVKGVNFAGGIVVDDGVTGVQIERSPIFNAATPITLGTGSNGNIAAPRNLRVGPRQPNGLLPVTGTVSSGMPGTKVAATVTGTGTSQYSATATVPSDITSPTISTAFAFSTNEVIAIPSEPLAGGSLNLSDFSLQMAGVPRAITSGAVAPDGSRVYLISSQPWNPGEAGGLSLTGPGKITDLAGNWNTGTSPVTVGAAPGDFQAPLVQNLKLKPTKICLTKGKKCRHPGVTISFITNEVGKAVVVINRASNRRAGEFVKRVKTAGLVKITWHGTIHGRKLRAGRYVIEVSMEDNVGNVTDSPPFQVFHIVRTR
jgi:hypothetical protein